MPHRFFWALSLCLGLGISQAETTGVALENMAPVAVDAIPYPNGSVYMARGLTGSFSGGTHRNFGESRSLYQWQGEGSYFYKPWLSGGAGFKMTAGEPSDTSQKVKNHFFILGRTHKAWSRAAGYFGLQLGVDDLNISLPIDSGKFSEEPLQRTNASLGVEIGLGWKVFRYVGLTLGNRFELSLVGDQTDNPESAVNFRVMPGLAFALLPVFPSLGESVKAFDLFTEVQFGRLVLESLSNSKDFAWIGGIALGF